MAHDLTEFQLPTFDITLNIDGKETNKSYDPFEVMFKLKMSMKRVLEPTGDMEVLKNAKKEPILDDHGNEIKIPETGLSKILQAFDDGTTDQLPSELPPLDVVLANVQNAFDLKDQGMLVCFMVLKTFISDMHVLAILKKAMEGLQDSCEPTPEQLDLLRSTEVSESVSS